MKRKFILGLLLTTVISSLISCDSSDKNSEFPIEKKYWTPEDYRTANSVLFSLNYNKTELPNLDNPKTILIVNKLVDTSNIAVVANDNQLGITHREEFLKNMFQEYKELSSKYTSLDKQDKYQYPSELVKVLKFGLYLQVPYIQVGNEKIIKESTNPNDAETKRVVSSNQQILIKNYNIYLDQINYQDRFSDKAIVEYAQGIDEYFPKLITQILPNGDFSETLELVQNMLKKAKNPTLILELQKVENLIIAKSKK